MPDLGRNGTYIVVAGEGEGVVVVDGRRVELEAVLDTGTMTALEDVVGTTTTEEVADVDDDVVCLEDEDVTVRVVVWEEDAAREEGRREKARRAARAKWSEGTWTIVGDGWDKTRVDWEGGWVGGARGRGRWWVRRVNPATRSVSEAWEDD